MKIWPYVVAVAAFSALAGVAIAGMPVGDDSFVLDDPTGATVTESTPVSTSSTTVPDPVVTELPDTVAPDTSVGSEPPVSIDDTVSVTAPPGPRPRSEVRLVLANGDGRFDLVGSNAERLLALGYVAIDQTDVGDRPVVTTLYVRPGFEFEALVLRDDLSTPNALIAAFPPGGVTSADQNGDIVVVLGPDAIR